MMDKYQKEVNKTYLKKIKKTVIDEVNEGEVIYLKIRNPNKSTIRHLEYYGKLIKKTKDYFYILEYTYCSDSCDTEEIKRLELNPKPYTKRRSKKIIVEVYLVKTQEKKELVEYYNYEDDID